MKKVVIIGANSFQNPLILKAKEMGYETHVFAWKSGDIGEKTADYFYPISITDKEQILEVCKKIKPDAVCSIASDLAVITVNYLAKELNLVGNDPKYSTICTNKYEMRKVFKENGVKVPLFEHVKENETIDVSNYHFPLIVKPTDRSGSRGVTKVEREEELKDAIKNATSYSFEKKAIVEEFITGNEYSMECISYKGTHHFLTVTKKYTTGAPHFIETGHMEPSDLTEKQIEGVKKEVMKALDALHVEYGPSHSEFKIDEKGNVKIIEIGARMGGDCIGSDLVQISTGYDFLGLTLDVALGKKLELKKVTEPKLAFIKFIFSSKDIEKLEEIKKEHPEYIHFISEISSFSHEIVDSSTRFGYYILKLNNKNELDNLNIEMG